MKELQEAYTLRMQEVAELKLQNQRLMDEIKRLKEIIAEQKERKADNV